MGLTKKDAKPIWHDDCEQAFLAFKKAFNLVILPVLAYPTRGEPFVLSTDASDPGMGDVLEQEQEEDSRVVNSLLSALLRTWVSASNDTIFQHGTARSGDSYGTLQVLFDWETFNGGNWSCQPHLAPKFQRASGWWHDGSLGYPGLISRSCIGLANIIVMRTGLEHGWG